MALFLCPDCRCVSGSYRTCKACGVKFCQRCVSGRPVRCVECTSAQLLGQECARAGCTELATEFSWRLLGPRRRVRLTVPQPLCGRHAALKSGRYSMRLIRVQTEV